MNKVKEAKIIEILSSIDIEKDWDKVWKIARKQHNKFNKSQKTKYAIGDIVKIPFNYGSDEIGKITKLNPAKAIVKTAERRSYRVSFCLLTPATFEEKKIFAVDILGENKRQYSR